MDQLCITFIEKSRSTLPPDTFPNQQVAAQPAMQPGPNQPAPPPIPPVVQMVPQQASLESAEFNSIVQNIFNPRWVDEQQTATINQRLQRDGVIATILIQTTTRGNEPITRYVTISAINTVGRSRSGDGFAATMV